MKARISYLDFLRCLAIFFVVALHAMNPHLVDTELYGSPTWYLLLFQNSLNRTGVPLFFMISGCLTLGSPHTRDIGRFYKKRVSRLIIPLLVWNLIYYLGAVNSAGRAPQFSEFVGALLNNGSRYHMWFIYTLIGLYLLAPFLKRIVDSCDQKQLLLLIGLIIFPTTIRPLLNITLPVYIFLFSPLMEGYVGYFLLGYLLGRTQLDGRARGILYCAGIAGYAIGVWGNIATASPAEIPLPFNGGYSFHHYLCAAALFVFFKTLFEHNQAGLAPASKYLAKCADVVFGVYWIHVLVLGVVSDIIGTGMPLIPFLLLQVFLTTSGSFVFMLAISRFTILRKILM